MSAARILLAEDHPTMADRLAELLCQEFDVVGVVSDGVALVQAARTLDPDVVVADISMPRLNGLKAVEQLRNEHCRAKFVLLSVDPEEALAKRALAAGASAFVVKTFAGTELSEAITAALSGKTYISAAVAPTPLQSVAKRNNSVP
jgi:DNA-binding NarL/FixJ family response regulator